MKTQETAPLLAAIAPAALVTPPVLIIGLLLGVGWLWFRSGEDQADEEVREADESTPPILKPSVRPRE